MVQNGNNLMMPVTNLNDQKKISLTIFFLSFRFVSGIIKLFPF